MARKPQFRINPSRIPDDSSGFTVTTDEDVTLAEAVLLSLPPGSTQTVDQLLSLFPGQYVTGQAQASAKTEPTA